MTDSSEGELNLARFRRKVVEQAIRQYGVEEAYRVLGIGRTTLYRWRRQWAAEDRKAKRELQKVVNAAEENQNG